MPQSICSSCKTDLYSAARTADLVDPRCPACGASQLRSRRPAPTRMASADHRRIAERFGEFMDRSQAQVRVVR
jgi:predicted RNA-binding Zn-ribbon protein involved in translation (DUF1610 family)